jgi:hypothetical protein
MALLVLSIDFLQNLMDLLVDVLNPLNESSGFLGPRLNMGRVCLCGYKRYPRVGISIPPEMGYGHWSYGDPYCNYVEHRGDLHPMYVDA